MSLDPIEMTIAAGLWPQVVFQIVVMSLRCNRVMALALRDDLQFATHLSEAQLEAIFMRKGKKEFCNHS